MRRGGRGAGRGTSRGAGGRGGAAAASRSPRRSPSRSPSTQRRSTPSTGASAAGAASNGVTSPVDMTKSVAQMQKEIAELEAILAERKAFFKELDEEGNTLVRMLGEEAHDLVAKEAERNSKGDAGEAGGCDSRGAAANMSEDEEIQMLQQRNAALLRALKPSLDAERRYGNDPKVLDKLNEVNLVKMQMREVEREIATLETVKKRRDGALREISRTEQMARQVRGQQREVVEELRAELKALMEELRKLEKEDFEAHERHARLQEQVKLGVSDKDVEAMRAAIAKQEQEIQELTTEEAVWKERKAGARDENQRMLAKEQKECMRLEQEVDRLRAHLIQRETELRNSYQSVGRTNVPR